MPNDPRTLYCSFCGLIAWPTVFICDECVELCRDIVGKAREKKAFEEGRRDEQPPWSGEPPVNLEDDFS